jgi:DNA-binding response OmpR family regulator
MNKTILLADDDCSVRQMLGRALNEELFDVIPAKTGREAINDFLKYQPDLVLLDLNMPEKDGWNVFHSMRQLNPWVPIIIITGAPNQFTRALRLGASALMEKPLEMEALLAAVRKLISEAEELGRADKMAALYEQLPPHQHPCELLAGDTVRPSAACLLQHETTTFLPKQP